MWKDSFFFVLASLGLAVTADCALSQSVVLSDTGNRWFAGDLLSEGQTIVPAPGETVRVIVGDEIVAITAPERHVVTTSDRPGDLRTLSDALINARLLDEQRRWLRDGGAPSLPPSLWSINIALGGTYCFVAPEQMRIWRPASERDIELQISDMDDRWDVFVDIPAGARSLPWPSLPSGAAGSFVFSPDPATQAIVETSQIDLHTELDAMLALVSQGCKYQLFLLTTGMPLENENGE